jgi:hypothetical protein
VLAHTPDWEVSSALATSVKLKLQRAVSRMMRSCWKFMRGRPCPRDVAGRGCAKPAIVGA